MESGKGYLELLLIDDNYCAFYKVNNDIKSIDLFLK